MSTATTTSVWRAALTFTVTSGLIGMSFGVLARTSGLSLAMTCALSLLVFAGGAQFLVIATIAAGGTPLAAVLGGVVLNARHLPYGLAVAPLLRGPFWKRALSSQVVLDESTALALAQPTPPLGRLAFYACGCSLFVAWNLGTLTGALAGGAIGDPATFGLDAAFPGEHAGAARPVAAQARRAGRGARRRRDRARRHAVHRPGHTDPARCARRARRPGRARGARVTWWAIIVLAGGTYACKAAGPLALGARTVPPALQRALTLLSVTLLSALVAISTFGDGRGARTRRAGRGLRGRARRRAG